MEYDMTELIEKRCELKVTLFRDALAYWNIPHSDLDKPFVMSKFFECWNVPEHNRIVIYNFFEICEKTYGKHFKYEDLNETDRNIVKHFDIFQ